MVHYDAFISYNHNPRDNKIAHLLQQKLEHYKVPKDLSSSPDFSGIERVFLDKGDLEVAGDLNSVIKEALEHTDHLIVICSPESKKSIWVKNEIEYFLQYHSINDILTVITEGEPFDVLPDRLLSTETVDEEGNVTVTPLEPLSCDYRMPIRKANKEELPRLVSALIGCRYDDLVQRQKAYKRKQQMTLMGIASVILAAAITYLAWSNHQIRTSYNNTLREQSMNLSLQSQKALKGGDRIGAIQTALAALPSTEQDRPFVSEAALALCESMDIYKMSEAWVAVEQYSSNASIIEVLPFTSGKTDYVVTLDMDGGLKVWNASNGKEVFEEFSKALSEDKALINSVVFDDDKTLLLFSTSEIIALDMSNESELYRKSLTLPDQAGSTLELNANHDRTVCIQKDKFWVSANDKDSAQYLLQCDIKTGNCIKAVPVKESIDRLRVSDDGKCLAVISGYSTKFEIMNPDSGKILHSENDPVITDMMFDSKGRLITCGFTEDPGSDYKLRAAVDFNPLYQNSTIQVKCYDPATADEIWSTSNQEMHTGLPFLKEVDNGVYKGSILCTTGNISEYYDSDGKTKAHIIWNDSVCEYKHTDDEVFAVLENGSLSIYNAKEKSNLVLENTFKSPVLGAETLRESTTKVFIGTTDEHGNNVLIQYDYAGSDSKWKAYNNDILENNGATLLDSTESGANQDGYLFNLDSVSYGDSIADIQYRNTDDFSRTEYLIANRKFEDASKNFEKTISVDGSDYSYCGVDKDNATAYFVCVDTPDKAKLLTINLDDGSSSENKLSLPNTGSDSYVYYSSFLLASGGSGSDIHDSKLYIPAFRSIGPSLDEEGSCTFVVLCIDPASSTVEEKSILDFEDPNTSTYDYRSSINASSSLVSLVDSEAHTTLFNFNGKKILASDNIASYGAPGITDDGKLLILEPYASDEYNLHVLNANKGKEENVIDLGQLSLSERDKIHMNQMSENENLLDIGSEAFVLTGNSCDVISRIDSFIDCNNDKGELILGGAASTQCGHVPYRPLNKIIEEANELITNRAH